MEIKDLINSKIETYVNKIQVIENAVEAEMTKEIQKRDKRQLDFLYKENAVYQFALNEFTSILNND